MTGYGRGEASAATFSATVEFRSVNHRFAEIRFKMPQELSGVEKTLQDRLKGKVQRGRLDININLARGDDAGASCEINKALVGQYIKAAEQIRAQYGLTGEVTLQSVLSLPDVIRVRPSTNGVAAAEREILFTAFDRAAASHDEMRVKEGEILCRDLVRRVAAIEKMHERIAKKAPKMTPLYARRLKERLAELQKRAGSPAPLDESRVAQEVALIADRSDITEELVRLAGYLEQLRALLERPSEAIGKKLDFVMQEMNREANTINSKAIDLAMCQDAIQIKAELEKIREQVQNIE